MKVTMLLLEFDESTEVLSAHRSDAGARTAAQDDSHQRFDTTLEQWVDGPTGLECTAQVMPGVWYSAITVEVQP
jgi:hypothetical protein